MRSDCLVSAMRSLTSLDQKLSPANDLRRTAQEHFAFPSYRLHAAGGVHAYGRLGALGKNRGNGGGAGSGAGGLRLADAALVEAHVQVSLVTQVDQLDVDTVFRTVAPGNFGGFALPVVGEGIHENYEMRIAHGDGDSADFARRDVDGELIPDLRLTHGDFEFILIFVMRGQGAALDSGAGADIHVVARIFRAQIRGHAASAVTGNFGF